MDTEISIARARGWGEGGGRTEEEGEGACRRVVNERLCAREGLFSVSLSLASAPSLLRARARARIDSGSEITFSHGEAHDCVV
jgi:hypothetical protein